MREGWGGREHGGRDLGCPSSFSASASATRRTPHCAVQGREAEAHGLFQQCVDVTPDMTHELIRRLR